MTLRNVSECPISATDVEVFQQKLWVLQFDVTAHITNGLLQSSLDTRETKARMAIIKIHCDPQRLLFQVGGEKLSRVLMLS